MNYNVDTITVTRTKIRIIREDESIREVIVLTYFRQLLNQDEVDKIADYLAQDHCPEMFKVNENDLNYDIPEYDFNALNDMITTSWNLQPW